MAVHFIGIAPVGHTAASGDVYVEFVAYAYFHVAGSGNANIADLCLEVGTAHDAGPADGSFHRTPKLRRENSPTLRVSLFWAIVSVDRQIAAAARAIMNSFFMLMRFYRISW